MAAELATAYELEDGEGRLRPPLLRFLAHRRWIRPDSVIVDELPWHGRRVDMVTMTRSGILASYELKIGSFGRVLEQAIYNRLSFDRSYLVVAATPRPDNLAEAARHGTGIILVGANVTQCILGSPLMRADPVLRQRLSSKILSAGAKGV
jgi:hypothetical protein